MAEKSFESILKELETLVNDLEGGKVPLDEAMAKYTQAVKLAQMGSAKIEAATARINKVLTADGKLEDFKPQD